MTRFALLLALVLAPLAAAAQAPADPSHVAAVRELLDVSGSREGYEMGLALGLDAMGGNNPMFAQLRPVFEAFYAEYAAWEDVEPQFVALYAELFTEDEVRALIEWYGTEIGRRSREAQPEILRRSMEIGQRAVMEHQAELQAMIREALESEAAPPDIDGD